METLLTARSRRCLALVEFTNWTCGHRAALAWAFGNTFTPISSRFSLGMIAWLVTHLINKSESSFVKCLEHINEFYYQVACSPLLLHETDPLLSTFPYFSNYRSGNGIAYRNIPFCTYGKAAHPPTTYLPGTFQVQKCERHSPPGRSI